MKGSLFFLIFLSLCLCGSTLPQTRVEFIDIAEKAGVSGFQHLSGSPQKRYIIETTASGLALFDYDRDGWLDIYFVNGGDLNIMLGKSAPAKNRLYRNNHNGTFTDVTDKAGVGGIGGLGQGVCVGDYNNDGHDDLYITNFGPDILYRNNGNGTFTEVTKEAGVSDPRWSTGAAFGDYDNDGDVDLFVANYVDIDVNKMPEPGGGGAGLQASYCMYRGVPVMCGPRGLKGAGDTLYRNNGNGTFTDVSKQAGVDDAKLLYGFQPTWIDYDNDGDVDLFVSNDSTGNYLYRNDGKGVFADVSYPAGVAVNEEGRQQACMGVAWGDYNFDGWLDLYLTNFSDDTNTLYQNDAGNFTDVTFQTGHGQVTLPYLGWGTSFLDFDNDGDLDLFAANGHVYPEVDKQDFGTTFKQRNLLFENQGGKFIEVGMQSGAGLALKRSFRGSAVGDLDNDGDLDIVVIAMDETPLVLRNEGGNRNNWVMIKLIGAKANRAAVGARVRARTGTKWQTAIVASGTSYLSQSDLRLHFGLGKDAKIDELEIYWPAGARARFTDLKANTIYTIDEAKGIVK